MSDMNFEAIGRCEHLREEIQKYVRERDFAFSSMQSTYRPASSHTVHDTVHLANMEKLREQFDRLDVANTELTSLVDEYNRWAPEAGKRLIKFVAW